MSVKSLIQTVEANTIKRGGSFTFSMSYSPEAIEEIKEMGELFTRRYQYTVAPIPGTEQKTIIISLKNLNRR